MKKWNINSSISPKNQEEIINTLLKNRGITNSDQKKEFLNPLLQSVTFESIGIKEEEIEKAAKRIERAIKNNEVIVIFGDYDVDGVTGTALLWETLYWNFGYKNVFPYIPHRINEGYGISEKGIDGVLLEHSDTSLIITVDNGIVAGDAIKYAASKKIDVIVTDHHVPGEKLPESLAIVHTTNVCGASVAFLLSLYLEGKKITEDDPRLDLVALATVADLVPLIGPNRVLLHFGIQALRRSKRPGIESLVKSSSIEKSKIGVYEIGHILAPRINAAGRLDHALDSLRILCTRNRERSDILARQLSEVNKERQSMTQEASSVAKSLVVFESEMKIIVSSSADYKQGIIGLIASRLTEEFYRPALVISEGEEISKGSARSIKGVNIIELIRSSSTYLLEMGGHPMAAGFSLKTRDIASFTKEISKNAAEYIEEQYFQRSINIDFELNDELITEKTYLEIQKLAPFGMGNNEPTFLTKNLEILDIKKIGKDKTHLKFVLGTGKNRIHAIGFGLGKFDEIPESGDIIDVVYTLSINEWNDRKTLQLVIRDYLPTADVS
ncbi:MAG: single-stranded-DNA-specific exonuclease RecJ [Candidatus Levybacteria bacterium]|nr:single-stranded-DNA-specific exonuclease RecJ [Candidatus Levybacteria bacterium]